MYHADKDWPGYRALEKIQKQDQYCRNLRYIEKSNMVLLRELKKLNKKLTWPSTPLYPYVLKPPVAIFALSKKIRKRKKKESASHHESSRR